MIDSNYANLTFVKGNRFVKSDAGLLPIGQLEVLHGAVLVAAEDDVAGRIRMIVAAGSRKRMRNFVPHLVIGKQNESIFEKVLSQNRVKNVCFLNVSLFFGSLSLALHRMTETDIGQKSERNFNSEFSLQQFHGKVFLTRVTRKRDAIFEGDAI